MIPSPCAHLFGAKTLEKNLVKFFFKSYIPAELLLGLKTAALLEVSKLDRR